MKALIPLLLLLILHIGCMASVVHGIGEATDFTAVARRAIVGKDGYVAILSEAATDGSQKRVWAIYQSELLSRLLADRPNSSIHRSALEHFNSASSATTIWPVGCGDASLLNGPAAARHRGM